jgi:hypothetical protein
VHRLAVVGFKPFVPGRKLVENLYYQQALSNCTLLLTSTPKPEFFLPVLVVIKITPFAALEP